MIGHGSITSPLDHRENLTPHFDSVSVSDPLQLPVEPLASKSTNIICGNAFDTSHHPHTTSSQVMKYFESNDCSLLKRGSSFELECPDMDVDQSSFFNQTGTETICSTQGIENSQNVDSYATQRPQSCQNNFKKQVYRKEPSLGWCGGANGSETWTEPSADHPLAMPDLDDQNYPMTDPASDFPYQNQLAHCSDNSAVFPQHNPNDPFHTNAFEGGDFRNDLDLSSMGSLFNNSHDPFPGPTQSYDPFLQPNPYFESCGMYR